MTEKSYPIVPKKNY